MSKGIDEGYASSEFGHQRVPYGLVDVYYWI